MRNSFGATWSASALVLAAILAVTTIPADGQGGAPVPEGWTPPMTPWGDPDIQGAWTNGTLTPLQRPADLAGQELLNDEELALRNVTTRLRDDGPVQGPVGFYNDFWLEQGDLSRRTALIVDPRDGRLPPVTPAERELQAARRDSYTDSHRPHGTRFDSWDDFNMLDRCITRGMPGLMMPGFYNHNYLILQTPDHVAIQVEMIHDARIIPLDGRPGLAPGMRQWLGSSRGRWEGDTLVVETTGFTDKVRRRTGYFPSVVFGGDAQLHVVERFTRVAADTIDYRFTVTDPTVWTAPWTASIPMTTLDGSLFEYACHEGNYAVPNALGGTRAEERAGILDAPR